jgi:uroporphyrinogen decarboxylase
VAVPGDVEALRPVEPERDLKAVLDAIRIVKRELGGAIPLIGFVGGPFTLASYAVEGGASRSYLKTKALMMREPALWRSLMTRLAQSLGAHARAQAAAGADVIQVFDSWAGALSAEDYREFAMPYTRVVFDALRGLVPAIHFATETGSILDLLRQAGGEAVGVDWRVPLDEAWRRLGDVAIQGNLDPAALLGPRELLLRRVDEVLARAGGRPGHIFNLGHGILPETPVENVVAVIEHVHARTRR